MRLFGCKREVNEGVNTLTGRKHIFLTKFLCDNVCFSYTGVLRVTKWDHLLCFRFHYKSIWKTSVKIKEWKQFNYAFKRQYHKMVKHTQTIRRQIADELFEWVWPLCDIGV